MHVEEVPEFLNIAKELLGDARVWDMQKYIQHGSISCLEHSFVVSYYSFTLVRKLRMSCEERSLVRGALLHDYFLYDWHEAQDWHRLHGFRHPFFANRNALRDFQISEREQEIIRKHMWPLTVIPPMCREAWVVNAVDTASGIVEVLAEYRIFKRLRRRWLESKLELLKQVKENL